MLDPKATSADTSTLTPHELEAMEKLLTSVQPDISPTPEFTARMQKRLERHYELMQQRSSGDMDELEPVRRRTLLSFIGTHVYSAITAFTFVIFLSGLSTFAYTSESVTNGSTLYPIKRGIEGIERTLAATPEARAEYQIKLITRRLAESRFLTIQGVIDEPTSQEVSLAVDHGIEAIETVTQVDYRDQLLDRITTILRDEEEKFYIAAGLPFPEEEAPDAMYEDPSSNAMMMDASSSTQNPALDMIDMGAASAVATSSSDSQARSSISSDLSVSAPADTSFSSSSALESTLAPQPAESTSSSAGDDLSDPEEQRATTSSRAKESTRTNMAKGVKKEALEKTTYPENIAYPLHVRPDVIEALEKNRQHLRQIEQRLSQIRRLR